MKSIGTKEKFVNGVIFLAISKYSNIIIQIIITSILARILTPSDFGSVAITVILLTFFNLLSDAGFSPAIIQSNDLSQEDINGIFTLCLYIGFVISIILFSLSGYIAIFYNIEVLDDLFKILCLCSFFTCLNIVPEALLKKNKRFKFIAIRTVIINILCGCLSIFSAYGGLGVYSLVITPVLSAFLVFLTNYSQNRLAIVSMRLLKRGSAKIVNYSIFQFFYNIIYFISRNLDKLVIGKVLGNVPLGCYDKSYHLMLTPISNLSSVVIPTIHPFFAEKQNDNKWMFCNCLRILHFLSLISFPLSVFCYFSAKEIITIFFGDQWYMAIEPFKILSLSIGFQVIYSPHGAFFQAANSTKGLFHCGLIIALLNIISIITGIIIYRSINILCYLLVISFCFSFFYVYYILVKFLYKENFIEFLSEFKKPILISIILAIIFLLLDTVWCSVTNIYYLFVIKGLTFLILIGAFILVFNELRYLKIK